jgi:hypothetical protein
MKKYYKKKKVVQKIKNKSKNKFILPILDILKKIKRKYRK